MKRNTLMSLAVAGMLLAPGITSAAAPPDPAAANAVVQKLGQQILDILRQPDPDPRIQNTKMTCALRESVDFMTMSRQVLGRSGRRLKDSELEQFAELFSAYAAKLSQKSLGDLGVDGFVLAAHSDTPNGDLIIPVNLEARSSEKPVVIGFRVRGTENGPKVVDLVVEKVSAAIHFNGEFGRRANNNAKRTMEILKSEIGRAPDCTFDLMESRRQDP
ncbi:MAG: ABC transporter substrate-binding protein [Alphaproteobacteria bacterium]|nr:ABC transporter substrate-binding protein [Alphaproteobacteria bacterium]